VTHYQTNKAPSAAIYGLAGGALSVDERHFFQDAAPWGFILFRRNVENPEQLRKLTSDLRDAVGWNAPILIDQEGGRVARITPPMAHAWAPIGTWCDHGGWSEEALLEALTVRHQLTAADLLQYGIDVNCAPLADLRLPHADKIIGDRAYGSDPTLVASRAKAAISGLLAGGVLPVVKHLPGHGRAPVDSHLEAPVVDANASELDLDFDAFVPLADTPLGMTAHVIYTAYDAERVATCSPGVIQTVIRERIGFRGALMTDDLAMGALSGTIAERTAETLGAGCDLALHCSGMVDEMVAMAPHVPTLSGKALERTEAALSARRPALELDETAAIERLIALGAPEVQAA
jgi:beta-N-acetylhexosaminidase